MNPLYRIIDANANRAREALRVMEDAARFALDDAALIERLKKLRHLLRAALNQPSLDRGLLLSTRDSLNDEGRDVKTPSELRRSDLRDIAGAAASRLTEALRSLEESAKAVGADSRVIENVRYLAYDAEKSLMLALATGRCPQWQLCVLITESLCAGRPWLDVAKAAIEGGADCIQLREKELEDRELLGRADALRSLGDGFSLMINDRPDVALLCGADGVHLGQTDLPIQRIRELAGFRLLIGVSTSNIDEARQAVQSGADYCGVGPMFPTTTKHKPTLSGPEYLKLYLADSIVHQRPHLAIGGITPKNIAALAAAGCKGVAVSSSVCSAEDPAAICRTLIRGLNTPTPVATASPR